MAYNSKTIFPNMTGENPLDSLSGAASSWNIGMENLLSEKFTPLVVSHAYIYWLRLPTWFEQDDDLKYYKALSQRNFNAFEGVSDISVNAVDKMGGTGNPIPVFAGIEQGNTDFSIEHNESSGSPMRKCYQKWISLIRDPEAKIATYPRLFGVEYSHYNHTGDLLYVVVRPDANNEGADIVEDAWIYSGVFPTNIPLSHFTVRRGSEEVPILPISFKGVPKHGPQVDKLARKILKENILNVASDSEDGVYAWVDTYNNL